MHKAPIRTAGARKPRPPWVRQVAAAVLAVEALALVALAVFYAHDGITATASTDLAPVAFAFAVFALLCAAAVAGTAWSVWRGGRFGRAFGLVWQALQVAVVAPMVATNVWLAFAAIVAAVVVAGCIIMDLRAQTLYHPGDH